MVFTIPMTMMTTTTDRSCCLSVIAVVDGFQHGDEPFFFKAIALGNVATKAYRIRQFDSTDLLCRSTSAMQTYGYQSNIHGWDIHTGGLPQDAAGTCISSFIQELVLDVLESNRKPDMTIVWTKGKDQMRLLAELVKYLPFFFMPIVVRDLEDIACPSIRELLPYHGKRKTTSEKIEAYLKWIWDISD